MNEEPTILADDGLPMRLANTVKNKLILPCSLVGHYEPGEKFIELRGKYNQYVFGCSINVGVVTEEWDIITDAIAQGINGELAGQIGQKE